MGPFPISHVPLTPQTGGPKVPLWNCSQTIRDRPHTWAGYRMSSFQSLRTPNRGVANWRPQIEHIMWGHRAAWSPLWWWPYCYYRVQGMPMLNIQGGPKTGLFFKEFVTFRRILFTTIEINTSFYRGKNHAEKCVWITFLLLLVLWLLNILWKLSSIICDDNTCM